MNKTALKNFATWSRRKLIEQVQTKALLYGIDEKNGLHIEEQFGQLLINGQTYPLSMKSAFKALQIHLEQKGYKQLLEEAAYTWFNRIIAIRYMEVHEYLPERVNVLSSSVGRVDPDILFEYDTMDITIKQEEVRELINAGNTEVAYRILFVAQCNALNRILPFMFEPIQDYTELLLPDFLLDAESVIKILVQSEELTESFAEIEVIGWLYQYYIAEEKNRVFAQKSKYKKEEIPFATQLFTPKWIVQYMVQNSLGRYWTEAHREEEDLIDNWEFFIKHDEEDFYEKIAPYVNKELKVEDIKLLDPAMGSGHILVYAFEVFHEIYEKCGYPERDIPRLILENNLYGLDIDDRAYQLAAFAVVMKATQYSRRFLRSVEREGIQLNLASIQETNHISDDVIAYIAQQEVGEQYNYVKAFFDQYHNAKIYGSLINITEREIEFIEERFNQIENNPVEDLFYGEQHEITKQVLPALVHQTKIMRNEYDVVVMNPPYMGSGNMGKELGDFLKKNYPDSKADLYSAFMEVSHYLLSRGLYSAINQHSWMFLNSFEKLREKLLENQTIDEMVHLGPRSFEDISGEVVQSTVFVLRNYRVNIFSKFIRLVDVKVPYLKEVKFKEIVLKKSMNGYYFKKQIDFKVLPSVPIAYWSSEKIKNIYKSNILLNDVATGHEGITTANNDKYLRFWYEVDFSNINFNCKSHEESKESSLKWYPYNKGGESRKWYGNNHYVLNWKEDGKELREFKRASLRNQDKYFKEGLTWSTISGNSLSMRYYPEGYLFDTKGNMLDVKEEERFFILAYLNSNVANYFLKFFSSTLDFRIKPIISLPLPIGNEVQKNRISILAKNNVDLSKKEWDMYERSYNFKAFPGIKLNQQLISEAYNKYFSDLKIINTSIIDNQKTINQFFVEIFDLNEEMTLEEFEEDRGFKIKTEKEYAKDFLAFFIGALVGRHLLYKPDGQIVKYDTKAVLNFTEKAYFEDDIISQLYKFLNIIFASNSIEKNLHWLAEALEMKNDEDVETRLRRYFLDEFFVDHCKMYQKHPIYWLVDSGKQKGLRTLFYMHRYQLDTMATIRFEQLQEVQAKYQQEIADLENRLVNPNLSATDKKKLNAEKVSFEKKIEELLEFDKRLAEFATAALPIDLDDGVKVNYEKFYRGGKGVLAKIK